MIKMKLKRKTTLLINVIVFDVVAVVHLLRILFRWEASIGGVMLPLWLSAVAVVLTGYLAWNNYVEFRKER